MNWKITSEEPDNHWGFINFKDKIVLDLGCGKFHSTISTYDWFLQNGAKQVIGVDLGNETSEDINFIYSGGEVNSKERLLKLLNEYNPQVIKSDIEGAEIHFKDIENIHSVKEFAIEYHSADLKNMLINRFGVWGFNYIEEIQLMDCNSDEQGVLYAKK
jgi:SAM-dependent methyltransferase